MLSSKRENSALKVENFLLNFMVKYIPKRKEKKNLNLIEVIVENMFSFNIKNKKCDGRCCVSIKKHN